MHLLQKAASDYSLLLFKCQFKPKSRGEKSGFATEHTANRQTQPIVAPQSASLCMIHVLVNLTFYR